MANVPSSSITKQVSLGSALSVTSTAALTTPVNLAKQALPIQGGVIGNFGGMLLEITTSAVTNGDSLNVSVEGSFANADQLAAGADGADWFVMPVLQATPASSTSTGPSGGAAGAISYTMGSNAAVKIAVSVPGPLPQYVRIRYLATGAGAKTATIASAIALVHG
jgi:hypothetical protein